MPRKRSVPDKPVTRISSTIRKLIIAPSQPIDEIAARHRHELPAALRMFLRGPGATKTSGAGVLSYLLFESGYCRELIELGRRDAMAKRDAFCHFLQHMIGQLVPKIVIEQFETIEVDVQQRQVA